MTRSAAEGLPTARTLEHEEFLAQYFALEALIEEADEAGDTNLLDIVEERQVILELENPHAARRLKREQLGNLDRKERQERLKVGESIIRARHFQD